MSILLNTRLVQCIIAGLILIIIIQIIYKNEISKSYDNQAHIVLFENLGLKSGSDKVVDHNFQHMYGQYLGPLRLEKINFLEIGLGCNMAYGPGRSISIWKKFLPRASISMFEFNEACARKFEDQVDNLFVGDQSNLNMVEKIGKNYGPFKVIVDDGGHSRKQQINSLIGFWPFIQQGGIYIIEDLITSFMKKYDDNPNQSTMDLLVELIIIMNDPKPPHVLSLNNKNITISQHALKISRDLLSVSFFQGACVLVKK